MSRYDHKIESCLEGIEDLSKEKKERYREKRPKVREKVLWKGPQTRSLLLDF